MKRVIFIALIAINGVCFAEGKSAGLTGIINVNDTVDVNGFVMPRNIWTVYNANDPSESAKILAYVAFKKQGTHQLSIEWFDDSGKKLDYCGYTPQPVNTLPFVHTLTCSWGGRYSSGGITFKVFNKYKGVKEEIGSLFLPSK